MPYGLDFCTGGTATSSGGFQTPDKGFDDNSATYYQNLNSVPCWVKYDQGAGITKKGAQYTIMLSSYGAQYSPTAWKFWGSNVGTDNTDDGWVELDSQTGISWSLRMKKNHFPITTTMAIDITDGLSLLAPLFVSLNSRLWNLS